MDHFSICACHPCAGAMLIFSVSFQFYQMSPKRRKVKFSFSIYKTPFRSTQTIWVILQNEHSSFSFCFLLLLQQPRFCWAVLDSSCAREFKSASSKLFSQPLSDSHNDSPRSLSISKTFSCEFRASCLPQFCIPHESLLVPHFGAFGFLLP